MVIQHSERFKSIRQISQGEYGEVYLAEDRESGKIVQITSFTISSLESETVLDEIEQDIYKIQNLNSVHILPVRDIIRDGNKLSIIYEFIEGETLEEHLSYSSIDVKGAIGIIRQVGEALTALHAVEIIHGDLKPAYILLSKDGSIYLSGFGIYKRLSALYKDNPQIVLGPLGYTSPEQAQGTESLDERSDLYSLGIIFYRMLSGGLPFKATSPLSIAVQHAVSPAPVLLQEFIPKKIRKLVRKAINKDPAKRFSSVQKFLDALSYRTIQIPKWATITIVLAILILVSILIVKTIPALVQNSLLESFPQTHLIFENTQALSESRLPANNSTLVPDSQSPTVTPEVFSHSDQENQNPTLTETPFATSTPRPTITSIYIQTAEAYSTTYTIQLNDTVFDIASKLQTDLSYFLGINGLTCDSRLYTGNEMIIPAESILEYPEPEFDINTNNVGKLQLVHSLECMRDISDIKFSPDGSILAAASNHNVFMWRISDWKPLYRIKGHNDRVTVITFSPDGDQLATGSSDNNVRIWSVSDGQLLQTIQQRDDITDLSYSPDGQQLAVTSLSLSAFVYNTKDWSIIHEFKGYKTSSAEYSPDNEILAISFNDRVDLFNPQDFSLIRSLPAEPSGRNLEFSQNGMLLASSNNVWQVADGLHIYQWEGPPHRVLFSADMESVIVGPQVIQMRSGKIMNEFKLPVEETAHTAYAYDSVALSPDQKMLVWGNQDGLFIYFGVNEPPYIAPSNETHYVEEQDNFFNIAAQYHVQLVSLFVNNSLTCQNLPYIGQSILIPANQASAFTNRTKIQKLNFQNIELIKPLDLSCAGQFGKLHFSQDNNFLVNGSGIWDLETGSIIIQGESIPRSTDEETLSPLLESTAKISPDNQTAATISGSMVQIWDLETGKLRHNLEGHSERITAIAYSNDGKLIATSGLDENIFLWNVDTSAQLDSIHGFTAEDLIFTPDRKMLISVAGDTARFWSVEISDDNKSAVFLEKQSGTPKTAFAGINGKYRLTSDGKYFSFVACAEWQGSHCIQQFVNSIRMDQLVEAHRYLGVKEIIQDFVFSPDGQLIAVASDNAIVLWNVEKEEKLFRLVGDTWAEEQIQDLSFTPDSQMLITQVNNRLLRVWNVGTGEIIHTERIGGLQTWSISPDQTMIAVIANNRFSLYGTGP